MRNFLIFAFCAAAIAYASEVEITAKKYDGDDKSGISKFSGNVKVVKGSDILTADTVTVFTDQSRKPSKMEATGNASFMMTQEGPKTYKGKAKTIFYIPNQKEYLLVGNAEVEYVEEKRKVFGERILINETTKKASVVGDEANSKPAKFIFYIDDKKDNK